jgi:hypothetical protein
VLRAIDGRAAPRWCSITRARSRCPGPRWRSIGYACARCCTLKDSRVAVDADTHDLTATTTEVFEVGETVEVAGLLAIDHDVGLDYRYPALLGDVKRLR